MVKKLSEQRLFNIALFYLSRYESTTDKVRAMLKRRLKKMVMRGEEVPPEASEWIENVIQKVVHSGYLNDTRYATGQIRKWVEQGKSARFITAKLLQAGIDPDVVARLLSESDSTEEERAFQYAKRKHLGPYRSTDRDMFREKDMASMARAGFPYDIVMTVLNSDN